jgi:ribosome-associated protein
MRLNKLQKVAVAALEEIKGQEILVLDVRKLTSMCDSMIIASAQSTRQVKALADNVRDRLREAGASIIGVEGEQSSEWVLVDCGDIVVHVMQPAVRAHYKLEELWTAPLSRKRAAAAVAVPQHPAADQSGGAIAA